MSIRSRATIRSLGFGSIRNTGSNGTTVSEEQLGLMHDGTAMSEGGTGFRGTSDYHGATRSDETTGALGRFDGSYRSDTTTGYDEINGPKETQVTGSDGTTGSEGTT